MCDPQDEDQEPVVLDRVDDAVVADPDPPPSLLATAEHLRPRGSTLSSSIAPTMRSRFAFSSLSTALAADVDISIV